MNDNLAYASVIDFEGAVLQDSSTPNVTDPPDFLTALCHGLASARKHISPKYFYDTPGSQLFDRICELPEYYPTRTELALLRLHAHDMAAHMGAQAELIEFGAGSLRKVRLLLDVMQRPRRFIPIDISGSHLGEATRALRADYGHLQVQPLVADYTRDFQLPPPLPSAGKRVGFFPGSTLGNFEPHEALQFLRRCAGLLQGGALIVGVDLVKNPDVLHAAYNDAQGVTAAFNRNLLARANRELGANFKLDQFAHSAFYNAPQRRIEMHLMSLCRQTVTLQGQDFAFEQGETLHTENSYKFTVEGLHHLALQAGWVPGPVWSNPDPQFCLQWLEAPTHRSSP